MSKKMTRRSFLKGIAFSTGSISLVLSPFAQIAFSRDYKNSGENAIHTPSEELLISQINRFPKYTSANRLIRIEERYELPTDMNSINETIKFNIKRNNLTGKLLS